MLGAEKYDFLSDNELEDLRQAAEQDGGAVEFAALARAYNIRGMFPQALFAADRATTLDPVHFTGWFEYAIAASAIGEKPLRKIQRSTRELLEKGLGKVAEFKTALALTSYYLSGDEVAVQLAREALAEKAGGPADSHAYEVLGYIAYNADNFEEAQGHFAKALGVDDSNFRAHWMVGHCLFELGNIDQAKKSYICAVEHEQYFANAWFSLGKVFLVSDQLQPAYQCFGKTLSINPRMWDCYFTQADYYLGHQAYNSAIASCHRILELGPGGDVSSEALNYIGEIYLVMSDYPRAQRYFEEAIAFGPENAVIYNNLGVTLLKQERVEAAIEHFHSAISKDPEFAYPATKLGHAYLKLKENDKAEEQFRNALAIDPQEYWAWLGLSDVYRRQRRFRKQLEAVLCALEIEEEDSSVYNYLGIAFESVKEPLKAEAAYLKSLQLDPLNRKTANNLGFLYEKFLKDSGDDNYRAKATNVWKRRLLICRDSGISNVMAKRHLRSLGVSDGTINRWLAEEALDTDSCEF
ncbi:MAG TPA: tetratricopeptide repeat protein [Acidobacteriota bacterium]|nr:tetratricopeptide repeat protein [Acidobacteriota bacterium]